MRVFTEKQWSSLAAILLTVITFAISPPDAFCRTSAGHRTRSSRTVRLDDHDHDYSPDLRSDDHSGTDLGLLLFTAPASAEYAVALVFAGGLDVPQAARPAHGVATTARGRAPPSV